MSARFGLVHVSTGDLLRAERQAGTALGRKADEIMNRGELVPDEMVLGLVRTVTTEALNDGRGVLYDGYPRNLNQLKDLERILAELGVELDFAINMAIDDQKLESRLTARRVCSKCQKVYNVVTHPPKEDGICDSCGAKLFQRGDDRPESIRKRLADYHSQTEPMLHRLTEFGKVREINADLSIEQVRRQLVDVIEQWQAASRIA